VCKFIYFYLHANVHILRVQMSSLLYIICTEAWQYECIIAYINDNTGTVVMPERVSKHRMNKWMQADNKTNFQIYSKISRIEYNLEFSRFIWNH